MLNKIYKKGFKWLYKRVGYELMHPKFVATKYFVKKLESFRRLIRINKRKKVISMNADDVVTVVYDLNYTPITFDFAHFLAAADSYGRANCRDKLFVLFIQKKIEPLLVDEIYTSIVSQDSQKWRFNNIVLQLVQIYPSCIGYSFLPYDVDISNYIDNRCVYPVGYSSSYKPGVDYKEVFRLLNLKLFDGFHASQQGLSYVRAWIKSQNILNPIVVITIRQYGYDVARNSNVQEWIKFAHWAKSEGFSIVFVPDTDACWPPNELLNDFIIFNEPCWNIGLRMALNELAYVNLFSYNGPSSICTLNKRARTIIFFPVIEESLQANSSAISQFGLTNGQRRYDFAESYQFLSWKRDYFENIRDEFLEFKEVHARS